METIKNNPPKKELNRLVNSMIDPSTKVSGQLKFQSYPTLKNELKNDDVLTRKLIHKVKNLQKQNRSLKQQIYGLAEQNKTLSKKYKQNHSCQSLLEEIKITLHSAQEIKPQRRLSESFACYQQMDMSALGILGKIDEIDEHTRIENNERTLRLQSYLPIDCYPKKGFDQQLRNKLIQSSQKISQLLATNLYLSQKIEAYKSRYDKLQDHFQSVIQHIHKQN